AVTLSKMLLESGDGDGAVRTLAEARTQAAPGSPDAANLSYELGRTHIILGNPAAGLEDLAQAAELAPEAPPVYGTLGVAYQLMGDMESARAAYETAIELGSQDPEDYFNLGTVHMNDRRQPEAIAMFTKATEMNPNHQQAFANIGLLHGRATEYAEAIEPLRRALVLDPEDTATLNELVYAMGVEGMAQEASQLVERYTATHPGADYLHGPAAFVWMKAGEPEKAIAAADRALDAGVHPTPALAMKSTALNDLGRTAEAEKLLDFDRLIKTKVHTTPAGYHSMKSFNNDLVQYLLDNPSLGYSKNNRSMEKGRGTLELFDGTETGPALILKQMIMEMAK
ncbi:MAG: tetratricopeptide repeat protein, partial [Kangiella sp.]|nr:tetratricopeptide repeat protein [Kangiella sp.]